MRIDSIRDDSAQIDAGPTDISNDVDGRHGRGDVEIAIVGKFVRPTAEPTSSNAETVTIFVIAAPRMPATGVASIVRRFSRMFCKTIPATGPGTQGL
jgi:hypothetical protein